jgi:putative endonuclease
MYSVYILYSNLTKKYYIGHTGNFKNRLQKHNRGLVKSTKSGRPWELTHLENYPNKNEAYKRELQIKSYKKGNTSLKLIGIL